MLKDRKDLLSYYEDIVETIPGPLLVLDSDLVIISANRNFYDTFKVIPKKTIGRLIYDLGNKQWNIPELRTLLEEILPEENKFNNYEVDHVFPDIGHKIMLLNARRITHKGIGSQLILLAIEDITAQRQLERLLKENNIIERGQKEDELQESEEKYRTFFETSRDCVFITSAKGEWIDFNDVAVQFFGYESAEELKKVNVQNLYKSKQDRKKHAQKIVQQGFSQDYAVDLRKKDGSIIHALITSVPKKNKSGKVIGFQGTIKDVTDKKRSEDALRESEQRYRAFINANSDMVYFKDEKFRYLIVNQALADFFGKDQADIVGKTDFDLMTTPVAETCRVNDMQAIRTKSLVVNEEQVGERIYETTKFPIGLQDGKKGLGGIIRDITGHKKAQEALNESRRRLSTLMNNLPGIAYRCRNDKDWTMEFLSDGCLALTGYPASDLIENYRLSYNDIIAPEDRDLVWNMVQEALSGKTPYEFTYSIKTAAGEVKWVWEKGQGIDYGQGRVMLEGFITDITDRKQAEEALRKSENQLSNAVKLAHLGPWEYDVASDLFTFTDAFYDIFRTTAGQVGGYTMSSADYAGRFLHPEDAALIGETIRKTIETKDLNFGELGHRIIYGDGETGYITVRIFIVRDENGKTIGAYGVNQDITERKRAEDDLRKIEEKYRQVVETAHEFIVTTDLNSMITFANKSTRDLFEDTDLVGMKIMDFTPLKLRQKQQELMSKRREGNSEAFSFEWEIVKNTGNIMITDIQSQLMKEDGKPAGVLFIGRDITDRKRAEEELKESEKKYRELYDFLPISSAEVDTRGILTSVNPTCYEVFRYDKDDIAVGMAASEFFAPAELERLGVQMQKVLDGTSIPGQEFIFLRKDGSTFPGLIYASKIIKANEIAGIRVAIIDITERKQTEDILKESEKKYREFYNFLPIPIYELDFEANITSANQASYKAFRATQEDFKKGFKAWRLVSTEDSQRSKENIESLLKGNKVRETEYTLMRLDGSTFPGIVILSAIFSEGKPVGLRGAVIDITERKQAGDDLQKSFARTRAALGATVNAMASLVETRDPYTAGHQRRVSDLARTIATEMGLPTDRIDGIRMAATIHDIGKISIPAEILSTPRKLTDIEFSLIQTHPLVGYDILKDIEFPWPIARIVLEHHERMDGSGYPNGLKGDQTLLESRIISVADVVEAMASHRPYRSSLGMDTALDEITKNKNKLYDPDVVDTCLRLFKVKNYKLKD